MLRASITLRQDDTKSDIRTCVHGSVSPIHELVQFCALQCSYCAGAVGRIITKTAAQFYGQALNTDTLSEKSWSNFDGFYKQ